MFGLFGYFFTGVLSTYFGLGRGPVIPPDPAMVRTDRKDLNSNKTENKKANEKRTQCAPRNDKSMHCKNVTRHFLKNYSRRGASEAPPPPSLPRFFECTPFNILVKITKVGDFS